MKWLKSIFNKTPKPFICYTKLRDIVLADFIKGHCEEDYSFLVVSGKPSEEELKKAWVNIYNQYVKLTGGHGLAARYEDIKQYVKLEGKIRMAAMLFDLAGVEKAHNIVVDYLNKSGYPLGCATKANLPTILKQYEGYVKRDSIRLKSLSKKLDKKTEEKETEINENYYYETIVWIAEALKVSLDIHKVNMAQYCSYINQYQKRVDQELKHAKK